LIEEKKRKLEGAEIPCGMRREEKDKFKREEFREKKITCLT
jgi:hypothetical protein